jgi:hypothetical protein
MFASMYFLVFEKKTFLHEAVVVVNNQPTNHACIPPQFFKTGGSTWNPRLLGSFVRESERRGAVLVQTACTTSRPKSFSGFRPLPEANAGRHVPIDDIPFPHIAEQEEATSPPVAKTPTHCTRRCTD